MTKAREVGLKRRLGVDASEDEICDGMFICVPAFQKTGLRTLFVFVFKCSNSIRQKKL